MSRLTDIIQCPVTGSDLHWATPERLVNGQGISYPLRDGIACLLPSAEQGAAGHVQNAVREFYDTQGWIRDDAGAFAETKAFSDTRRLARAFTDRCITRLGKYFKDGGEYLLDAGSGPIPYDALERYGDNFEKRVCVDLSIQGLRAAKAKLGDRAVCLQGDLTKMPVKSGSMDAVTCNHVIYQLPPDDQSTAFLELWRVLKPGGVAVIVYIWPDAPLARRVSQLARLMFGSHAGAPELRCSREDADDPLPHNAMTLSWFHEQKWPFSYKIDSFRIVSQGFMRDHLPDDWRGRAFLSALYTFQCIAPRLSGLYGDVPAMVIRKPAAGD